MRTYWWAVALALGLAAAARADEPPELSLAISRAIATEGSRDPVRIDLRLSRPAPEGGVCVDLDLAGGTARPIEDFNGTGPGQVPSIPAGASMLSVPIMIVDDALAEPDETVRIVIRPSSCYRVGEPHAFDLLIRDDDDDPGALADRLQDIIANTPDPLVASQISHLAQVCATSRPPPGSELDRRCQLLRLALRDPASVRQLVDSLRGVLGEELSSQRRGFRMLLGRQFGGISRRLEAVRGGGGAGLALTDSGIESAQQFLPIAANVAGDGELLAPGWGAFATVTVGEGERSATDLESGYDSDLRSLLVGVDKRLNAHWVLGLAGTRSRLEADLDADAGDIRLDQSTLTGYASFAGERGWLDGSVGLGRGELRQLRVAEVNASTADETLAVRDVLLATPDTDLRLASLSAGWDWQHGGWSLGPRLAVEYARFDVDAFAERAIEGVDAFALALEEQRIRSLIVRAGGSAQWVIPCAFGLLLPQFDAAWVLQLEDSDSALRGRFVNDPQGLQFSLPTSPVDTRYADLGVSVAAQLRGGRSLFFSYRRLLGVADTEQAFWSLGARFEF